jgi:hypothetical protein
MQFKIRFKRKPKKEITLGFPLLPDLVKPELRDEVMTAKGWTSYRFYTGINRNYGYYACERDTMKNLKGPDEQKEHSK